MATIVNQGAAPCVDVAYEVDFEVESGPAVTFNATTTSTSTGASDDGSTPTTPDATCTATATDPPEPAVAAWECSVQFTSAVAGTNVVRAWVDDDTDNSTFDADTTEGQVEGTAPGNRTEVDDTDVVSKTWFAAAPVNLKVDCDDAGPTTPVGSTLPSDEERNPAGQSEVYTCHAFSDTNNNGTQNVGELNSAGIVLDAEQSGANDPDNSGAIAGTADYNDACTTGADGNCTFTLSPSENQVGTAELCFWADADGDNELNGASPNDGSQCTEAFDVAENDDQADDVRKIWVQPGVTPVNLDASPEVDNNPSGTTHPMTATVTDEFGNPIAGSLVDFDVEAGRNVAQGTVCNDVVTNASGVASCTYTDAGTAVTSGNDTINVYVTGSQDAGEARETEDVDLSDTIFKVWTAGGPPAAAATVIDMDGSGGSGGAADCTDTAAGTPTAVGTAHLVCGDVLSATAAAIPGAAVTFTTNLGFFTNAAGDDLGQSISTTADENGEAFALLISTESGTATVTLTSGSASDSGTVAFVPLDARNIDCSPDTATNPTGTTHVVTCTATDRYGNPTATATGPNTVFFSESGAGRIDSATTVVIGADGTVEVVTSTTDGEEGTQAITAEFTDDVGETDVFATDSDEACDQPADDGDGAGVGPVDPGAPAGNCEETVEKIWSDAPPVGEDHARTLHLNKGKHVNLGDGQRSLKWSGELSTDDGLAQCSASQQIKVQIRAGGSWITRKSDTTNSNGKFSVLIRDIAKKYRAVAPKSSFTDDDGAEQTCLRAVSNVRKHEHGSGGGGGAKFVR